MMLLKKFAIIMSITGYLLNSLNKTKYNVSNPTTRDE